MLTGLREDGQNLKIDLLDKNSNETFTVMVPPPGLFDQDMPRKPTELASLMESRNRVAVTVLIKETKAKTERLLVDWEVVPEDEFLPK